LRAKQQDVSTSLRSAQHDTLFITSPKTKNIRKTMRERIEQELDNLEKSENVRILYACESGSRAWGFASQDSDWDVRFIYARPTNWYLSINLEHKRDVIERPLSDELDISGWDLRKALVLLQKSNPPLLEWLQSPMVYLDRADFASSLRALLSQCYSPVACAYHYRQMAKRNFDGYLTGEIIRRKKYFYVLRPLLALRWIEAGRGLAPTEFALLLEAELPNGEVRRAVDELLEAKKAGGELDAGPPIGPLQNWIETEMTRVRDRQFALPAAHADNDLLDELFRATLASE